MTEIQIKQIAEKITRRLVENTIRGAWVRAGLGAIAEVGDGDFDEQEMVDDAIAIALGEDTGCLGEDEIDAEHIDVLFVQQEIYALAQERDRFEQSTSDAMANVDRLTEQVQGMKVKLARYESVSVELPPIGDYHYLSLGKDVAPTVAECRAQRIIREEQLLDALRSLKVAKEVIDELVKALAGAVQLSGGWREAIAELEDFCSEPVRLKNMIAAIDQIDNWKPQARAAIQHGEAGLQETR